MQKSESWKERRQSPRRAIVDGVMKIAGVHTDAATTRLLDLNRDGLSFQHMSVSPLPEEPLLIDLLVMDRRGNDDLFLHRIVGEILSLSEIEGIWGKKGGMARRYSLRFKKLSSDQQQQLERFLGREVFLPRQNAAPQEKHYAAAAQ